MIDLTQTGKSKLSVCLCMIVRDEEINVQRALKSAFTIADSFVILDTGSRDKTIDKVRQTLNGREHHVVLSDWKGFSESRNEALLIARKSSDYVIFLDADDFFVGDASRARAQIASASHWLCFSFNGWVRNVVQFAVRSDQPLGWIGERHEYIENRKFSLSESPRLIKCLSKRYTHSGFRSKQANTWKQDLQSLREEWETINPDMKRQQCRNMFYQAQTLQADGDLLAAQKMFVARAAMHDGDEEERWYAELSSVRLAEILELPDIDLASKYSNLVLTRSRRAEAYLDLARRLRMDGRFREAETLGRACAEMPLSDDWICVDTAAHSINAWDEQAINFHVLGLHDEASRLWRQVLLFGNQSPQSRNRIERAVIDSFLRSHKIKNSAW